MDVIHSGRITRRYTQRIEAPPDRVFPLICPVREADWLHGWGDELEMVYSDSGVAEDAFRDDMAWWERSMNHWLRTGETLGPADPAR